MCYIYSFLKEEGFHFIVLYYFTLESNNYVNRTMSVVGVRGFFLKLLEKNQERFFWIVYFLLLFLYLLSTLLAVEIVIIIQFG